MMHLGTFVRRTQHIQDIFLLTHQLTIVYIKMDQQYINILHQHQSVTLGYGAII